MIRPLVGVPSRRIVAAYGIDTASGAVLAMWEGQSLRMWPTVLEFLEQVSRGGPTLFVAYGGGRFQVQPVMLCALDLGVTVLRASGVMMGSIASRITLNFNNGRAVQFGDLAMALPRGSFEEACEWSDVTLHDTPAGHVRATFQVLHRLQAILLSLGSTWRGSVASAGYDIFRRTALHNTFATDLALNKRVRPAYYTGRTEVHRTTFHHEMFAGQVGNAWDMNSAYGWAMSRGPIPGYQKKISRTRVLNSISKVRVRVSGDYPALPYRTKSKALYFPTGEWDGWFHESELIEAESHGVEVLRVYQSIHFSDWNSPATFACAMFDKREKSKDKLERKVIKAVISQLAGKLGQQQGYERLLCYPKEKRCPHNGNHDTEHGPSCYRALRAGVYVVTDPERPHKGAHVPAACAINAIARVRLNEGARYAIANGGLWYLGTDAVYTLAMFEEGSGLGDWRLTRTFDDAHFLSSQWYRLENDITASGMPHVSREDWDDLVKGIPVGQHVVTTLLESIKQGGLSERWASWHMRRLCSECYRDVMGEQCPLHPEATIRQTSSKPKRKIHPDGTTTPWDVDDLGDNMSDISP